MTTYTSISNALVAVGAKPFATTIQALRDNIAAQGEADTTVPAAQLPTVLLGTLATTSGSSVTLSSLVLTPYKSLKVVFSAISTDSAMSNLRIAGELCSDQLSDTTWFFNGLAEIDLGTGIWSSSVVQGNSATGSGASSTYVGTSGYSTVTTSVVFSLDTGNFDAGSILVYGCK